MPDVTVLMAVYNSETYLRPAIDSILAQSYSDFEFLIVDDGSSDASVSICRSYTDRRMRVIALPANGGLARALNAGLAETRTELVARFDPDDVATPSRLGRQRDVMLAQPELALLGSQAVAMTPDGHETGTVRRSLEAVSIRWSSLFANPFVHPTVMFRTSVVRAELGGFRSEYDPFAQDYELWSRLMERHAVANLPDRLVRHRVHGSSIMGVAGVAETRAAHDERFVAVMQRLLTEHAARLFGASLPDDGARLLPALILGIDAADVEAFLALFDGLLAQFKARHRGTDSVDFARTLARQFDTLAVRVRPASRRATARIYTHALRSHPEVAAHLSWPRTLALLALGKSGRDRAAAWSRRYLTGLID